MRFASNRICIIPQWIGGLTNLNVRCAIARIVCNTSRALMSRFFLQALALQDNAIESLPMTFVNLSNLKTLDLGGNKMQGIPVNVLEGGAQALLQFMRYNNRYDS